MKFTQFRQHFSSPRIDRYLTACSNNTQRCIMLYKSNLKVAQAFHPMLGNLEVVLRNGINDQLVAFFTDPDWIINQKTGFMVHPILTYTNKRTGHVEKNRFLFNSVKSAEDKLKKKGVGITSGRVISEQTLGFWTDLFENHHYKILQGRPIKIFRNLPSGFGRSQVLNELTTIRKFRNRINHNEPICFVGGNIDFAYAIGVYNSVLNILNWINPELLLILRDLDKIAPTIARAQRA